MKTRIFAITFLVAVMLCGCSKSEHDESTADFDPRMELERPRLVASQNTDAHQESETSGSTKIRILLPNVVYEFGRRGGEDCTVTRAEEIHGVICFEWTSFDNSNIYCAPGEVLAAVMSVLRGYSGQVNGLELVRTFGTDVKRFSVTGTDYHAFAEGRINDDGFLEKYGLSD